MKEVTTDLLNEVLAAKEVKSSPRKKKEAARDFDTWFFGLDHTYGKCENPDCIDTRGKVEVMTALVREHRMCRFCFLGGWLDA